METDRRRAPARVKVLCLRPHSHRNPPRLIRRGGLVCKRTAAYGWLGPLFSASPSMLPIGPSEQWRFSGGRATHGQTHLRFHGRLFQHQRIRTDIAVGVLLPLHTFTWMSGRIVRPQTERIKFRHVIRINPARFNLQIHSRRNVP